MKRGDKDSDRKKPLWLLLLLVMGVLFALSRYSPPFSDVRRLSIIALPILAVVTLGAVMLWAVGGSFFDRPDNRPHNGMLPPSEDYSAPLPGKSLEHDVARLIQVTTGRLVRVCTGSSAGIVDVEIFDRAGKLTGIVQCIPLYSARSISIGNVRALAQLKRERQVATAFLVTSAHFSRDIRDEAKQLGVKLIDGAGLQRLSARAATMNHSVPTSTSEDSRWRRPGAGYQSSVPSSPTPIFGEGQPRHVLITNTPRVIIPHQIIEAPSKPDPVEEETQAAMPAIKERKRSYTLLKRRR